MSVCMSWCVTVERHDGGEGHSVRSCLTCGLVGWLDGWIPVWMTGWVQTSSGLATLSFSFFLSLE